MISSKCPGQDTRYWKAEDIHEQECPYCGAAIEFWKTDLRVRCPNCQKKVVNPRFNLGCASWCSYAAQCLGETVKGAESKPLRRVLDRELLRLGRGLPLQVKEIQEQINTVEAECRALEIDPLPVLTAVAVLGASKLAILAEKGDFYDALVTEHQFPPEAVLEARRIVENVQSGRITGEQEKLAASALE